MGAGERDEIVKRDGLHKAAEFIAACRTDGVMHGLCDGELASGRFDLDSKFTGTPPSKSIALEDLGDLTDLLIQVGDIGFALGNGSLERLRIDGLVGGAFESLDFGLAV